MNRKLAAVGFGLLLAAIAGEAGARLVRRRMEWNHPERFSPPEIEYYRPRLHCGYATTPGAPESYMRGPHDAHGFRGPAVKDAKDPGAFRIVVLGGSTVYGTRNREERACWPRRLEAILRASHPEAEVVNAGVPAHNSADSLAYLRESILPLRPDLLIYYGSTNDTIARWIPGFRGDYTHMRATWSVEFHGFPERPKSAFLELVFPRPAVDPGPPLRALASRPYKETLDTERAAFARSSVEPYCRNLRTMTDAVRSFGGRTLMLAQQYLPERIATDLGQRAEFYQKAFPQYVDAMRRTAAEAGAEFADAQELVPPSAEHFDDFVHHTDEGADALAHAVAGVLEQRALLRR